MAEFSPPDPSTYYGADHQTALINYRSQQNMEDEASVSSLEARQADVQDNIGGLALAKDASVIPVESHQLHNEENTRSGIVDALHLIKDVEVDSFGYKRVSGQQLEILKGGLDSLGILTVAPTEVQLNAMYSEAAARFNDGTAESYLRKKPFLSATEFYGTVESLEAEKSIISWSRSDEGQLFIKPDAIDGVGSDFHSWFGDSAHVGKNYTTADGKPRHGTSQEAIIEYAVAYKTQLPELEATALNILITDDGPVCMVDHGAHRTAAAMLRGEPLAFSSFVFYDARTSETHPEEGV